MIKRTRRTLALAAFILFLSSPVLRSQKGEFSFIQITDPQFGMISNNKDVSGETALYNKAVEKVNQIRPAFVVITGDLVNDMKNKSQWDEFRRITAELSPEIKVYYSPGNHDIGQDPKTEDIDNFRKMFESDRFSFIYKRCRFIGINTCIIKSNTPVLEEEQLQWLEKELKKGEKARETMIFTHYPFFMKDPEEAENYSNIKPEIRKRYLDLFSEYGVDAVFSGHLHNNAGGKYKDTEYVTTSAVGRPLGQAPSGFRVIKVSKDGIKHEYMPLD